MSRAALVLKDAASRAIAKAWVAHAKPNSRVEFKGPRRSNDQNGYFWLLLTDVAMQKRHHGERLTPMEWRLLFLDALTRETRTVPSLDGTGVVDLGRSSSDLSVEEMTDIIEIILAWGANNGVQFSDHRAESLSPPPETRGEEKMVGAG